MTEETESARQELNTLLRRKHEKLVNILLDCGSVCIGYSGGVDSVYLAKAALDVLGPRKVLAVTGLSAAYPTVQRDVAVECARRFGIPHVEIRTEELSDPAYRANGSDRCYFCKSELWTRLSVVAAARGLRTVLDGSNADDASDYRPGLEAARELGVRSPLLEAGLTKAEVRELSRRVGLPTWDQPAAPCLSSRLHYGLEVTPERLRQVEEAESIVRGHGFREFRVRHHGGAARLEVSPADLARALELRVDLDSALRSLGFRRVLLDVEGYRRGALNEVLSVAGREREGVPADGEQRRVYDVTPASGSRDQAAERVLREGGVDGARVTAAGHSGNIAAVEASPRHLARVAALAPEVRSLGYRYVTVDLAHAEPRGE